MCGSLLSKFKNPTNKMHSGNKSFTDPSQAPRDKRLTEEDVAWTEHGELSKDGHQTSASYVRSMRKKPCTSSLKEGSSYETDSSETETESAVCALVDQSRNIFPSARVNNKNDRLRVLDRDDQLLETAREILISQLCASSSSSNSDQAVKPFSSAVSTVPNKTRAAVAFNIPAGKAKSVCPPARVPRRFRQRKVAPEPTLEDIEEKMRAVEKRKMKELERVRETARSKARLRRPHPAMTSAQATAVKIAAKQAAAERKRREEMEKRRQAGNKTSRSRRRIADAQAFVRDQLQLSIQHKEKETEQRKIKWQMKIDKRNKMKQKYAKKVKDRVTRRLREEEAEIRVDLQDMETYKALDDSSDESWGDEEKERVKYDWEDFFSD